MAAAFAKVQQLVVKVGGGLAGQPRVVAIGRSAALWAMQAVQAMVRWAMLSSKTGAAE
jgi:hypothetical protein